MARSMQGKVCATVIDHSNLLAYHNPTMVCKGLILAWSVHRYWAAGLKRLTIKEGRA